MEAQGQPLYHSYDRTSKYLTPHVVGWSLFLAINEVGRAAVLCDPANVRSLPFWIDHISLTCRSRSTTLAAVVLDYMGLYCESSWGLGWGHIWVRSSFLSHWLNVRSFKFPQIMIVISLSVTIAMFCLIQLYVVVAKELAPHKPLLKLFSVKAVGKPCCTHAPFHG